MLSPDLRHRTHLFAPGLNERLVKKALATDADAVVIDLEDGIDQSRLDEARGLLMRLAASAHGRTVHVRAGMDDDGYRLDDLRVALALRAEVIRLPKVEEPKAVAKVASFLDEANAPTLIHITIESSRGLMLLKELIGSTSRVTRLVFGERDFLADMGVDEPGSLTDHARAMIGVVSRAMDIGPPLDGAFVDLGDAEGLRRSCERARGFGFGGKSAIHPDQLSTIDDVFSVGAAEVEGARRIIKAFDKARSEGDASTVVDGRFIDEALARRARSVLADKEG